MPQVDITSLPDLVSLLVCASGNISKIALPLFMIYDIFSGYIGHSDTHFHVTLYGAITLRDMKN